MRRRQLSAFTNIFARSGYCVRVASTNGVRRGPGRPPNPTRARERQRTLTEAAALEFAEKGYHKASITDITQRAGVGRGTFYLYFDTKRDALDAVIDNYFQRTVAAVNDTSELLGDAVDFHQYLRTVFTRLFDMLDNSPEIMQVILREGLLDSAMTKRMFGILDLAESVNTAIIERARADGAITSAVDSTFLAHAITGLSMAATLKAIRGELAGDAREAYIGSFIELVRAMTTIPPTLANS